MKKIIAFLTMCSIFIAIPIFGVCVENNLVQNPSFEQIDGIMPANWETSVWDRKSGVSEIKTEKNSAYSGETYVTIINNSPNDARFTQSINVKENTAYKLSCRIKTENVGTGQNSKGANISIEGKLETSRDIKGTNNKWEYAELYARTGSGVTSFKLTIGIGGYGAVNTGKASFDDVMVEEVGSVPDGAVVAQLSSAGTDNDSKVAASTGTSPIEGPGKDVLFLIIAALIVAVAGAAYYYFRYAKSLTHKIETDNPEENFQQLTDEIPAEKTETVKAGIAEKTDDDSDDHIPFDREDLL